MGNVTRLGMVVVLAWLVLTDAAGAQANRIDVVTPLAPELAARGPHAIGVRTVKAVHRDRPDVLNTSEGGPLARADRPLTFEVWYPAALEAGQRAGGTYAVAMRDPSITVTLHGQAVRDAKPHVAAGPFPLVVISHGYPGNRFLLSHLGEHLASHGFVVSSIDHTGSTYDDQRGFASTLYHRPHDQLFAIDEMARLAASGDAAFPAGLVDASRVAIVGYSMGGFGALNVAGAGFSASAETMTGAPPNRLLADRGAANAAYRDGLDARVKAVVAIGPWGMTREVWDAEGLRGIRVPVFFVAGSADEVSGYEQGVRAIFRGASRAERHLLTFVNAGHNAGAPIPAPAEAYAFSDRLGLFPFLHYADAVWDTTRMNNVLAHFATVFLGLHLKGETSAAAYLDVVPVGKDAVFAVGRDGIPAEGHTYWKGFKRGTAVGLILERLGAEQ